MTSRRIFTITLLAILALAPAAAAAQDRVTVSKAVNSDWVSLTGTVKSVGPGRFSLADGNSQIVVEMEQAGSLAEGVLESGDRVTVTGRLDPAFQENRTVEASSVYMPKLDAFYAGTIREGGGFYASRPSPGLPATSPAPSGSP